MRLIDADAISYTMLYKENWLKGTGVEAQGVFKSDIDNMPTIDGCKMGVWVGINEYLSHLREETGEFYKVSNLYDAIPWCNSCWCSNNQKTNFCPHCGARMGVKRD